MADTTGAITHRRVLKIALPVVAANVTVPILGAVDTGVVGQLGEAAPIGAVGLGAIILTAIYWIFGFLRMGTAGLASQALGAGDRGELAAILTRVLMIGLAGGTAIILLQVPIFYGAFLISPASDEVEGLARAYMGIRVWSAPAIIALYGVMGWLIAQERTRGLLVVQLAMNGVNIGLDLLFVLGFDWGVQGVAVATVISEWSGLALGLWLCRGAFRVPAWRDWARVFDRVRLVRMARVNTDILIRSLLLEVMIVSFMFTGARFGDVALAANQVLLQFLHVTSFAMDGFAFGAEALVGQALGARNRAALRRAAIFSSIWAAVVVVVLAAVFALAGGWIIDLMATDPGVREAARGYLVWMVLAPLVGWAPWMLDGIFIGATRTADMRNMMLVSLAVYLVALAALVPWIGNHGLWAAYIISYAARGVTLALRYPALEKGAG
ncbi:MATE family efflux transporter [Maritimibacter sp. UBA3975]|mgnify:CR=1 FL=1|uniref:MATE family efflux transporter n=1 Tax=Maritimibacter sp. UBA3975 TaxID=1946833 RepID=UPI000C09324F|nr:MATE family efflux transporter [Maritimibacter sp. UBA3975]MAM60712.1 MATE family efflux transporter [Maritimibacter sp.]